MTALTNSHRRQISQKLLSKAFAERWAYHEEVGFKLGLRVYEKLYAKETREVMVSGLPKGFLPTKRNIRVARLTGEVALLPLLQPMPFSYQDMGNSAPTYRLQPGPLSDAVEKWQREEAAILSEESALKDEVRATLLSLRTVKQALNKWPEIEGVVVSVVGEQVRNLPAIPFNQLNKKLNLG